MKSIAAVLVAAVAAAVTVAQPAPAPTRIELSLRPAFGEARAEIGYVDVILVMRGVHADQTTPLARLALVSSNVETVAATVSGVDARDALGPLILAVRHDGPEGSGTRSWFPNRPVEGAVTLRYRAPISNQVATRGAAPPLELRSEAGAFSGAGSTFLLLPELSSPVRISVRWDLGALPAGAIGVSSLGIGDVALDAPQPAARLERSFFMAGRVGRYPASGAAGLFFASWQGEPPFDTRTLMEWTGRLHGRYLTFFRPPDAPPYGVFLRHNPVNAGGGVSLSDSFVSTFGPETDAEDLKLTLAHEMFHTFSPILANPAGLESSWFSEGLAVFYARTLALRFGAIGAADFLRDLNYHAGRYYTNALGEEPNSAVPLRFWADTRIRTLPYDRGSLYFAVVNDRMRKASAGRHSLDDLMLAMVQRQRTGRALANADWEELLRQHLGEAAVVEFHAFLAGRPPLPASDAFGPCFRRAVRPLRRYVLGFEPAVLTGQRRIVRGLIPGSAAEQAGLRDGDEIVRPVPQDGIQGNQTQLLRLEIRRDGRVFPLSYLPRGETVQAYQWERVGALPDSACAI